MITTVQGFTLQDILDARDAAVASGNRTVYFPPGEYVIDGEIVLTPPSHSNLTFVGVPGQSVIRQTGVGTGTNPRNIFRLFPNIAHVTFRGLSFEGPGLVASAWDTGCAIYGREVRDILVEDCRVSAMGGAGIGFSQGSNTGQALRRITVRGCYLSDNLMPTPWRNNYKDITVYGACEDVTIEGNTCLSPNDTGISVQYPFGSNNPGGEAKPITNVTIADNRCEGHARHGIIGAYGRTIPDGLSVVNNVCKGNGWIGTPMNLAA